MCGQLPAPHTVAADPYCLQLSLYSNFLRSKRMNQLLFGHGGGDSEGVLPAITILRKVCNHPKLLMHDKAANSAEEQQPEQQGQGQVRLSDLAVQLLQQHLEGGSESVEAVNLSGKLVVPISLINDLTY